MHILFQYYYLGLNSVNIIQALKIGIDYLGPYGIGFFYNNPYETLYNTYITKIRHYGDKPRKSNVINGGGYGDSTDDIEAYQTKGMIDLCNEINKWGDLSRISTRGLGSTC